MVFWVMTALCGVSFADVTRRGEEAAKKNKNPIEVPEVRAVSANFIAGGSVELELIAAVGTLRTVEFVIRQQPQHGVLSDLRPHPTDSHKALITYTHRSKDAPVLDSFSYACRLGSGPFSAPGRATLNGQKFDPILKVRTQPKFERLFAGGQNASIVEVENVGAAPYHESLKWEHPFFGPSDLTIPPGQKVEFVVSFKPERSGGYRWQLPLQASTPESVLYFYGDSIPALTVSPGQLTLKWDAQARKRTGVLTLANSRPDVMDARLILPKRLQGQAEVNIEPQSKQEVRLSLESTDVQSFKGELLIEAEGVKEQIWVTAGAQPPSVSLVEPREKNIDFGHLKRHSKAEQSFTIANDGGQELLAGLRIRPPFSIEEANQIIRLDPGQSRRFVIQMDTRSAGRFSTPLEISGGAEIITLQLSAVVAESQTSATPMASAARKTPSSPEAVSKAGNSAAKAGKAPAGAPDNRGPIKASTPEQMMILSMLSSQGISLTNPGINPYLDVVQVIEARDRTQSGMVLAWNKPQVKPASWRVETASNGFDPKTGVFVKFWEPVKNLEVNESDANKISVNLDELKPGSQYEFRVIGVDQEGKFSRPSPILMVSTLSAWRIPAWVWRASIIAALVVVFYILYRMRRGDFEFEF